MAKFKTIFQNLEKTLANTWDVGSSKNVNTYDLSNSPTVLYKTDNKEDYEAKKLELRQQKYLSNLWRKTSTNLSTNELRGLSEVKIMYRDAELMDGFPEIGAALDLYAEESCTISPKGDIVNVYSKSDRIKSVIEDLLVNRLEIQVTAPMVIRNMCKYGNQFMVLNISNEQGIMGWRQMPVSEVERVENGIFNSYAINYNNKGEESTKFIWLGGTALTEFKNWQVAHFRLITDSMFLPYGQSVLNKARRHFRMLSLMEDSMLIYRLERSVERRVYKIYVGALDDADVPSYIEEIANNFKRTPIIDPQTGQIDLRKNILDVTQDLFLPTRDPNAPTPIDTLAAGQNLTAIDDIKYIQQKVLAGLRIPKTFLNYEESVGDGKNLALMDVRFTRVITRIQQAFLMELTKIVTIHLYLMGFKDDLTNFSLSMNSPSTQAEQLEIENLSKKITAVRDAVSDPGSGIPIMSMTRALKEIMKWSDSEIKDNLEEIRLEKALAAELEKTSQIIKRTKLFDIVDKIYGEPGAEYLEDDQGGLPNDGGADGGGSLGGGGGFGDGLDTLGDPNSDTEGEISGEEGSMDMEQADTNDNIDLQQERKLTKNKKLITENKSHAQPSFFNQLVEKLDKKVTTEEEVNRIPYNDKSFIISETYQNMINEVDKYLEKQ